MSLMAACVVQALRRALDAVPSAPANGELAAGTLVGRAVAAVRARPGDNHTLDSLAGAAGMSRSTFIRHFRRVMRTSPVEYLQRMRLEEARAMLRTTSLPVKTIAAHTGFINRSHFSRLFRATFGEDPTSYRRVAAPEDVG
jgi:AraC family transcriptional regulator, activator of mtrCDE